MSSISQNIERVKRWVKCCTPNKQKMQSVSQDSIHRIQAEEGSQRIANLDWDEFGLFSLGQERLHPLEVKRLPEIVDVVYFPAVRPSLNVCEKTQRVHVRTSLT
jgi:hypothetical protein